MEHSTVAEATQQFVRLMTERAAALASELTQWATSAAHTLGEVEQQTLVVVKELGQVLLTGVCGVLAADMPAAAPACRCGQPAPYLRHRAAQVRTVLGPLRAWNEIT